MGDGALELVVVAKMHAVGEQRAVDVALVFALLAAVLGVAFVRRGWFDADEGGDSGS